MEGASGALDAADARALLAGVVIGDARTFQQDPRFGLVVLAEIASRALSPAANDPGTAIDVVGTAVRLLSLWGEQHWEKEPVRKYPHVAVPALSAADFFDDVFRPVARDGAGMVEVGAALQKAFQDLASSEVSGFADAARHHSRRRWPERNGRSHSRMTWSSCGVSLARWARRWEREDEAEARRRCARLARVVRSASA